MDYPQDFKKPIMLLVTGSANVTKANVKAVLDGLCFDESGGRDISFVMPFDLTSGGPGLSKAVEWAEGTLDVPAGDEMTAVIAEGAANALSGKFPSKVRAEEGITTPLSALEAGLNILSGYAKSREVFCAVLYDPEKDLEIVNVAKNYQGIRTVNLCEAGIDSFEGYESTDDRLAREKAEAEFAEKVAAEAPPKPAAKKATAPRKRAVKKVLVHEDVPLTEEPEKAAESRPETGLDELVAKRVALEEADRKKRELEREDAAMRESLVVFKPDDDGLIDQDHRNPGPGLVERLFDTAPSEMVASDTIAVKKEDLLRLLEVLTDIVKGS